MAKYQPLHNELARIASGRIEMTFAQIEQLVGRLPASAWNYPWWWGRKDNKTPWYVQCKAWAEAGYMAEADIDRRLVVFTRKN
jgi:hypothetical protein